MHFRGKAENRFPRRPLKSVRWKIGRTISRSIISAGDIIKPLGPPSRAYRWRSRCTIRLVIGFKIPAWAGATKWLVSLLRVSFPPRSHPLLFRHRATRASLRDDRIKHFATTIYDTFVREAGTPPPQKVPFGRIVNFSADAVDISYIRNVLLTSFLSILTTCISLIVVYCAR